MTFQPDMTSVREGITVIDDLKCRTWPGMVADVWHARLGLGARGEYVSPHPRLFMLLEQRGGAFRTHLQPDAPAGAGQGPLSFVPAGMPLWARCETGAEIRHLDLHFDPAVISDRVGETLDPDSLARPRIMFADDGLRTLARLIAAECTLPQGRHELYGDGLALALLIDLLGIAPTKERRRTPLADWQLRRVTDFIEAHCERGVRLAELAELVDLSQSYFSHAFKASTGMPPHQWQMKARIRRVQHLLLQGEHSLIEIAAKTGFSDQAHLTRAFRRAVRDTPGRWQKANTGRG